MKDFLTLWKTGIFDTAEIAEVLKVKEHVVYNELAKLRGHKIEKKVPGPAPREKTDETPAKAARRMYMDKARLAGVPLGERRREVAKYLADIGLA